MLNSLLAILNSRKHMRQMYESSGYSGSGSNVRMHPLSSSRGHTSAPSGSLLPIQGFSALQSGERKVLIEVNTTATTEVELGTVYEMQNPTMSKIGEIGRAI